MNANLSMKAHLNTAITIFLWKIQPTALLLHHLRNEGAKETLSGSIPRSANPLKPTSRGISYNFSINTSHPTSRLHKIFNRNTVKVSYSCMPNVKSVISRHNNHILSKPTTILHQTQIIATVITRVNALLTRTVNLKTLFTRPKLHHPTTESQKSILE